MSSELKNTQLDYNFSVLVVDDDEVMRYGLARELRKCGCSVNESDSVEAALAELSSTHYDIVFCDMRFPGGQDGDELLATAIVEYPDIRVVLLSCSMDSTQKTRLLSQGAAICLRKPVFKDLCLKVLEELGGKFDLKAA